MWKCPKCAQKVDDAFEVCWACGTSMDGVENPGFFDEGNWEKEGPIRPPADVDPESLVTLIECSRPAQAHAIRVRLESEGIPVFLFDELSSTMMSNTSGGVTVQVPEPNLAQSRDILGILEEEADDEPTEEEPPADENEEAQRMDRLQAEDDATDTEGIVDVNKLAPPVDDARRE